MDKLGKFVTLDPEQKEYLKHWLEMLASRRLRALQGKLIKIGIASEREEIVFTSEYYEQELSDQEIEFLINCLEYKENVCYKTYLEKY